MDAKRARLDVPLGTAGDPPNIPIPHYPGNIAAMAPVYVRGPNQTLSMAPIEVPKQQTATQELAAWMAQLPGLAQDARNQVAAMNSEGHVGLPKFSQFVGSNQPTMQSPELPQSDGDGEVVDKRARRLLKNRDAAKECRRKKKEYVRCLEDRVRTLEAQNERLIRELKKAHGQRVSFDARHEEALLSRVVAPPEPQQQHDDPARDGRSDSSAS